MYGAEKDSALLYILGSLCGVYGGYVWGLKKDGGPEPPLYILLRLLEVRF